MKLGIDTCKKTFGLWYKFFTPSTKRFASSITTRCTYTMTRPKPPNVFIYTGEDDPNTFAKIKKIFQLCLNPEQYVIYHLLSSKMWKIPWQDNTLLLVVSSTTLMEKEQKNFKDFSQSGGHILGLCSNLTCNGIRLTQRTTTNNQVTFSYGQWDPITTCRGPFEIVNNGTFEILATETSSSLPVIVKTAKEKGITVISQVQLVVDALESLSSHEDYQGAKRNEGESIRCLKDILASHLGLDCSTSATYVLSPAYLVARTGLLGISLTKSESLLASLQPHWQEKQLQLRHQKLKFHPHLDSDVGKVDPDVHYPVIMTERETELSGFSQDVYFRNLRTRHLGAVLIYADTITSTMDLIEGFPVDVGAVVVANIQTKGKGRSSNMWLSPRGCAMFSVQLCVDRDSALGQALPLVQQLATLAVIRAIKTIPGHYQNLDIGLKWPNDLYYAKKVKFGGILANSTMLGNAFHCYIGFGVNLGNSQPTGCLNDFIQLHNSQNATQMQPLTPEEFVARVVNQLEEMVDSVQQNGTHDCLEHLYTHWIHKDQKLMLEEAGKEVVVEGVDEYGFLVVRTLSGEVLTLHPDGNGLDQMRNLIIVKK